MVDVNEKKKHETQVNTLTIEVSKWEELCFTEMGKYQQCQSKKWNPRYYDQTMSCSVEGWHNHYYCKYCKFNFNPFGQYKKPKENDECNCKETEVFTLITEEENNSLNYTPEEPEIIMIESDDESEEWEQKVHKHISSSSFPPNNKTI